MSSITVTTQAGIHSSHKHNNPNSTPETSMCVWIPVLTIMTIILVRGIIKTFK
jgi:hypothetical protein